MLLKLNCLINIGRKGLLEIIIQFGLYTRFQDIVVSVLCTHAYAWHVYTKNCENKWANLRTPIIFRSQVGEIDLPLWRHRLISVWRFSFNRDRVISVLNVPMNGFYYESFGNEVLGIVISRSEADGDPRLWNAIGRSV